MTQGLTNKPELLAPAGTLEKLRWAVAYGADAVYFGLPFGSLRAFAGNLTMDQAAEALDYLHQRGKKGYITLNIFPFTDELDDLVEAAKALDRCGADGFIVSDLGLLAALRQAGIAAPLHISTQANVTNAQTALEYGRLGARRVNLARELSAGQIEQICRLTAGKVDIEVFVHGSVCFSYSGRCAISDWLAGQPANRGQCKQACRWKYAVVEETRPGQFLPVYEDARGLYLFNSRDLALFEYVPALAQMGVAALKIEGRMKSINYIATVVSLYRQILDGKPISRQEALAWLARAPHRGFSTGFFKGNLTPDDYDWQQSQSEADSVFVGQVEPLAQTASRQMADPQAAGCIVRVHNPLHAGQTLEVLSPGGMLTAVTLPDPLETPDGLWLARAHNNQRIRLPQPLPPFSILRTPTVASENTKQTETA